MMFYILNILFWLSIPCNLFLFYHFICSSNLRNKLRNHIIFCLLIVNFIQEILELPPRLYLLYTGIVLFPNPIFCQLWNWYQFTLVSINQFIMAIASFEHYLSIFHRIFLSQHSILLYQLPLFICILLPAIFYAITIYTSSCITIYHYTQIGCGVPCFFSTNLFAAIFKNIIISILPVIVIIIFNILIIIRVFIQQKRMNQHRHHHHHRLENIRMMSQLLPLAILYLIIWIPLCIIFILASFGTYTQKSLANTLINDYFGHLKYLINFFCPFFILMGQPELHDKLKRLFFCCKKQHTAAVVPMPTRK